MGDTLERLMERGQPFAGRFKIERLAGAGGMGVVYRAIDEHAQTRVALKVMFEGRFSDAERFHREVALLRELRHPAIPRYVAHGTAPLGTYLAMEWIEGTTLAERLEEGALDVGASLRLTHGVASALAVAHRQGVVHRDIKPRNLMLEHGEVESIKVLDFGVARYRLDAATLTRPGVLLGTPGYMAPEQARGEADVDARADVFSLGCVFFECLTGRSAFSAGDLVALLAKLVVEDPPPPSAVNHAVPPAVDELVLRMLAKQKAARPADGDAVVAAIDSVLAALGPEVAGLGTLPSMQVLTQKELRLVSVVLASGSAEDTQPSLGNAATIVGDSVGESFAQVGLRRERLADGTMLCSITGTGVATDQAARAAQCALILRAHLPMVPIAVATGRGLMAGPIPVGAVIDRAVGTLRAMERDLGRLPDRGWIAVDELTAGLLDTEYDVRGHAQGLFLAGKREPLHVKRALLGRAAPFVGRERDIVFLEACCHGAVADRVASAALVTAPAGAGKSRLVGELLERLRSSPPAGALVNVWIARADAVGAGSPFALVGQLIRRAAAIRDDEPVEVRRRKLAARVRRHLPDDDAGRVVAFLGELSSTWFSPDDQPSLRVARQDATLMREEVERAWRDFIAAECSAAPLVLVLENLHWGDYPSVKLIGSALRRLPDERLFVLAAARPEVHEAFPGLWQDAEVQELRLSKLSRAASRAMVREVLGAGVPEATVEAIVTRAGGNAFYLEELIRAVAQARGAALPETLVAMMNARLDALDPDARRVLRGASVFGDAFWLGGLEAMLSDVGSTRSIEGWLRVLADEEVIELRRESRFHGEVEYAFRHALIREAAYATLIPRDRTLAHREAAAWLERAGETDAIVQAEHFELGGEPARAVALYRRAAEQALEGGDLDAAMGRAARGITCGAAGHDLGALRNVQGEVHALRGENTDAERCGTDVLAHVPRGSASWCWAASATFVLRVQLGDISRAREIVSELSSQRPEAGAELAYVRACAHATTLLSHAGMHDVARALLSRIADAAVPGAQAAHAALGWACFAQSHVLAFEGDPWAQLRAAAEGARGFSLARSDLGVAAMEVQRGAALVSLGRFEEALEELAQAVVKAERLGADLYAALARLYEGAARARLGDLAGGRAVADQAATAFYRQGNPIYFGIARMVLAEVLALAGDLGSAEREASEAALVLESVPALRCACLGVQGAALLRQGRAEAAAALLEGAHATLEAMGPMGEGEAALRLAYAEALRTTGREAEARSVLASAYDRLRERAARIQDEAARGVFLTRVAEHARTVALARELGAA